MTPTNLSIQKQRIDMHRGLIYVIRRVNGCDVPLRIENQHHYREWIGCFSAI